MTTLQLPPQFDTAQVQVRRAEVTDVGTMDGAAAVVEARLAPYEREAQLDQDLWEVFSRGAFAAAVGNPSRVKVTDQGHQRRVIVGHAIQLRDEPDAIYGKLMIVDTAQGRDMAALFRAGSLSDLSVEFRVQPRYFKSARRQGGGLVWRHDRAVLMGVSPVGAGAYGDEARVMSVREAQADLEREKALARLRGLTAGPQGG